MKGEFLTHKLKFKAVIFDLDGTLLNTLADIGNAANQVLLARGYPPHPVERYRNFVGDGAESLMQRILPESETTRENVRDCLAEFMKIYGETWRTTTVPYPGIQELLNYLTAAGIKMAVLSNKPDEFVRQCVADLLSGWTFQPVFGFSGRFPRKPDPAGAIRIAEDLKMRKQDCVIIGDSGVDMQTAGSADMFPLGAGWGFRSGGELMSAGCRYLAASPQDALSFLLR